MMKRALLSICFFMLLIVALLACYRFFTPSLEYEGTVGLEVSETAIGDSTIVDIGGACLSTGAVITGIKEQRYNDEINLIISIAPVSFAKSAKGYFQHGVIISHNINKISLGRKRHVVWVRGPKPETILKPQEIWIGK